MALLPLPLFSVEEYLDYDSERPGKHEFDDGHIVSMAGASPEHNTISVNLSLAIGGRMNRGICRPCGSDQRVRIEPGDTWVYPDFTVACERPVFLGTNPRTLANPSFMAEILSPSTAGYDRDLKTPRYKLCPSVKEFVLIEQKPTHIEHWTRGDTGDWHLHVLTAGDAVLRLASLGIEVPVSELYEGVEPL
jgi:Uma2 family endonuclease